MWEVDSYRVNVTKISSSYFIFLFLDLHAEGVASKHLKKVRSELIPFRD